MTLTNIDDNLASDYLKGINKQVGRITNKGTSLAANILEYTITSKDNIALTDTADTTVVGTTANPFVVTALSGFNEIYMPCQEETTEYVQGLTVTKTAGTESYTEFGPSTSRGRPRHALHFDGSTSYTLTDASLSSVSWGFGFYIKCNVLDGTAQGILYSGDATDHWRIFINTSNQIEMDYKVAGVAYGNLVTGVLQQNV